MEKELLISSLEQIGFSIKILPNKIIATKEKHAITIYNDYQVWHIFKELLRCGEVLKMNEINKALNIHVN